MQQQVGLCGTHFNGLIIFMFDLRALFMNMGSMSMFVSGGLIASKLCRRDNTIMSVKAAQSST